MYNVDYVLTLKRCDLGLVVNVDKVSKILSRKWVEAINKVVRNRLVYRYIFVNRRDWFLIP
jgi:hypothetical protein